jgi:hypothetical protein
MRVSRGWAVVAVSAFLLSACGGGSGSSIPSASSGGGGGTTSVGSAQAQSAVVGANAAGAPVADVTSFETGITDPSMPMSSMRRIPEFGYVRPMSGTTASPSPNPSSSPNPSTSPAARQRVHCTTHDDERPQLLQRLSRT